MKNISRGKIKNDAFTATFWSDLIKRTKEKVHKVAKQKARGKVLMSGKLRTDTFVKMSRKIKHQYIFAYTNTWMASSFHQYTLNSSLLCLEKAFSTSISNPNIYLSFSLCNLLHIFFCNAIYPHCHRVSFIFLTRQCGRDFFSLSQYL